MPPTWICPLGHRWENDEAGKVCPVCSSADAFVEASRAVPDELPPPPAALLETAEHRPGPLAGIAADRQAIAADGDIIGPYKLLQEIGRGGFGVVYMAEQTKPIRRTVALKIIKPGMDTEQVIARFESERQALALMDHPNIAKVFDAGATSSGRPYFVMELVKGVPITEFCDTNRMPAGARLTLFIDACHAIQHAHHKGIIHRDIKPSNVLVTLHDGIQTVKVIDFGVAKATVQKLTERTLFTSHGQMIGTPAYMSPEQAEMSGLDIDTRSDVYSLGVLLYELLTGTTPLELKRLGKAGYTELQRLIREEESPRPSTRLSALGDSAKSLAGNRGTDAKRLASLLARDLDWIVLKALEKNRDRRYNTPADFADDVERYRRGEAILARPASTVYKLKRLARRNRAAVLTATVILAALLAGTTVAVWQAVLATRAKQQAVAAANAEKQAKETAEAKEADTRAVLDFVENKVFAAARPEGLDGGLGYDVTLRHALASALPYVETSFRDQPLIEAHLRATLGASFIDLGEYKAAADQYEKSRTLYTQQLGPEHPDTLRSCAGLATCYGGLGRRTESVKLFQETLALQEAKLGLNHRDTLTTMSRLANSLSRLGQHEEALALDKKTLELTKAAFGPEDPDTLLSMSNLADSYGLLGQYADALKLNEATLAIRKAKLGRDHPDTLQSMSQLATIYSALSRHSEALKVNEETLALRKAKLGPDHPDTLRSMNNLATNLSDLGRHADALKLRQQMLPLMKSKLGIDHPHTLWFMHMLADSYAALGRQSEAIKLREDAVELARTRLGPDHAETLWGMYLLAESYAKLGRHADALKIRREILALAKVRLGPDHADTFFSMQNVAVSLRALGRYTEALNLLEETLARRRAKLGPDHADTLVSMWLVADSLMKLNRGAEAVPIIDECVQRATGKAVQPGMLLSVMYLRFLHFQQTKDLAGCRATAEMWEKVLNGSDAATRPMPWPNSLYNVACMRAVIAAMVKAGSTNPVADTTRKAKEEADLAMAWLQKAIAAGFKNVEHMKKDKDLDALREREDFQKLLGESSEAAREREMK